ncbi:MAG: chloride channel protein [Deltaproteobacteria bacterium]|nr:chloride channel protein [Deltaproteobacteria bacterium]
MEMKDSLTESGVIFISVFKWFFLATCIGALVGASTYIFLELLEWGYTLRGDTSYYFLLMPVAFFISALLIDLFAREARGYGTEKIIEAVHRTSGRIKARVVPVKLIATVITIVSGGSAGKVGPAAQIGAGLTSMLASLVGFNDVDRKKLVICGISAGFASVFGAPVAGAIFGIEVLFVGGMMYDVLLPSFVAGIVGFQVANYLGVSYTHHALDFVPIFTESFFIIVALSGVFFGLCSFVFIEFMNWTKARISSIKLWVPYKGFIGGCVLVVLAMIFSEDFLGVGDSVVERALIGGEIFFGAFLIKMLFTSITFGSGGTGGIISPIFFIGATAGVFFANILGLNPGTFAAIGIVSLLAGAANTPITASIMAVELFGPEIGSYAAVACIISFLMTGHRSIFPSQVLALRKSASFNVELGKEVESIRPHFEKRSRSFIDIIIKFFRAMTTAETFDKDKPETKNDTQGKDEDDKKRS